MKKLFVFILMMVFIVSGCTTRVYDSNMELGKTQLKEENYLEAYEAFELAYKDDPTAEAKELMELSGLLSDGMKKFENEEFDEAQAIFEEAAAYKAKFEEGKLMVQKAIDMSVEIGDALVEPEPIEEETEVEESTEDEQTEDIPESEAEDNPAVETETPEEVQEDETPVKEEATEDGATDDDDEKESDQAFTKEKAEQLVKDFVEFEDNPHLQIQYDHDDENGDFIFQVFEVVNNNNEGGHTATFGWYGVNKKTQKVYSTM